MLENILEIQDMLRYCGYDSWGTHKNNGLDLFDAKNTRSEYNGIIIIFLII